MTSGETTAAVTVTAPTGTTGETSVAVTVTGGTDVFFHRVGGTWRAAQIWHRVSGVWRRAL